MINLKSPQEIEHIARGGAMVEGRPVADRDRGGVVIVWVDADGTRSLRFSDHTDDVVHGPARIGASSIAPHAFVGAERDLRVVARVGTGIVVFPTVCGL